MQDQQLEYPSFGPLCAEKGFILPSEEHPLTGRIGGLYATVEHVKNAMNPRLWFDGRVHH
ncbi:MAG: hypothetical protein J0L97_06940 [Alphaproteobacteria bacterium]|nr:hypothetical protein [Alphaproteobacteria bacterium]